MSLTQPEGKKTMNQCFLNKRNVMHASTSPEQADQAEREKRGAALASVFAAIFLTVLKLGVGIATNSLGMLSEALHSGLDLLAAGLTYFAVRFASLPPDPGHPYGHGKMENLSALVESLLLLITCVWIVWEAVDRLFFNPVHVAASPLAVGVMIISIIVDYSRSRMLKRMAEKHRSQALEADALHFSTDIWSSCVVLVGLGALYVAASLPDSSVFRPWLEHADSLAALGVSGIVVYVSYSLGKRAVNVLLDAGDGALMESIRASLEKLPVIREIRSLRVRHSGPDLFVDATLGVDSSLVLEETRHVRREVETAVLAVAEHATVGIEIVPEGSGITDPLARLRGLAAAHGLTPHAVELMELEDGIAMQRQLLLELHVELEPKTSLGEAHALVCQFENQVRKDLPGAIIVTHLEPKISAGERVRAQRLEAGHIQSIVRELVAEDQTLADCHNVLLRSCGNELYVSFHCRMHPDTAVAEAHNASTRLQAALHKRMPELARVIVHMEPFKEEPGPARRPEF